MPTAAEVLAVARLARLTLTAEEVDGMAADLRGILRHIDALRTVAGGADMPAAELTTGSSQSSLRADVPGADPLVLPPADLAPAWHEGFFTVPRLRTHDDPE